MTETMTEETVEHRGEVRAEKRQARRVSVRRNVIGLVLAMGVALFGYVGWSAYHQNQQSATILTLSKENLQSQNNHHASTIKKDAQLQQALNELKASAAVIEYEGGVIAYQNGQLSNKDDEILAAQQAGHEMLVAVAALQTEINADVPALKAGLDSGQSQINTFLHFLACVGTNPTDPAVCGAEPPLPPT